MRKARIALVLMTALGTAACGGGGKTEGSGGEPENPQDSKLKVTTVDFGFLSEPSSVRGGTVKMTVVNEGKEPHEVNFYRLKEGVSFEEWQEAALADPRLNRLNLEAGLELSSAAGGLLSNVDPGQEITTTIELESGSYGMVCQVMETDKIKPHYALGMIQSFEVT